jgi:membrane protein implicated in regulation of membrane protease activity
MDALIGFLDSLTIWHWLTLAVVLLVLELLSGTTYLLWPFVAAVIVGLGLASPIHFGWQVQLITFAAITGVLTLAGDKFVAKRWLKSDRPMLNVRAEQLRGEKVIAAAAFVAGAGRVRLADSVWEAEIDGAEAVAEGAVLEVVGLDGTTLKVRAL